MDFDLVCDVVADLQARGSAVTVRAIHAEIGGSMRDITRHLRALRGTGPVQDRRRDSASELASVITRAIAGYRRRYPTTDASTIAEALRLAAERASINRVSD